MSSSSPVPGWYPDPWSPYGVRWWDGAGWTGYTAMARNPAAPQFVKERPLLIWAKIYAVVAGLTIIVGILATHSIFAPFHHYFHEWDQWRKAYNRWEQQNLTAGNSGTPAPPAPSVSVFRTGILLFDLVDLPLLGLTIVFYVWISKAAVVARSLGYAAAFSPGWCVAVWFTPFVSFWMPAQALRSLLPRDHPARARVWMGWFVYLASLVLIWAGALVFIFGSDGTLGWVLVGGGGAASAAACALLYLYVGIVGRQHRMATEALT